MTDSMILQQIAASTPPPTGKAVVKIMGLGGGGQNAINRMIELGLDGVDFIAANTDAQALSSSLAPVRIQVGPRVTRGLGAGGGPKIGAAAAMGSSREPARGPPPPPWRRRSPARSAPSSSPSSRCPSASR